MMRLVTILCVCLMLGACGKKDAATAGGGGEEKKAAAAKTTAPKQVDPASFFRAFKNTKGVEALKRWKNGVHIRGQVLRTVTEMNKTMKVQLDANDGNYISLSFKDKGAAAKAANLAKGSTAEATCKVGGGTGKYVMLLNCELIQ